MTHAELLAELAGTCDRLGYWWRIEPQGLIRCRCGRLVRPPATRGWIDMVILGPVAWFVEAKTDDGRRTRAQINVAGRIARAGLRYRLVRPADLPLFTSELESQCM